MPRSFRYWTSEFAKFFNPVSGFDIDGAWIDMNDPSSVCCSHLSSVVLTYMDVLSASFALIPAKTHLNRLLPMGSPLTVLRQRLTQVLRFSVTRMPSSQTEGYQVMRVKTYSTLRMPSTMPRVSFLT